MSITVKDEKEMMLVCTKRFIPYMTACFSSLKTDSKTRQLGLTLASCRSASS